MTALAIGAAIRAAGGLVAEPAAVLDDDRDGDLRVVRGREAGEPGVRRLALAVLGRAGLAGDLDAGDLRPAAGAGLDDLRPSSGSAAAATLGVDGAAELAAAWAWLDDVEVRAAHRA